ncbi:MAG: hypothetical protein V7754_23390, partial [Halioglobus sp.]
MRYLWIFAATAVFLTGCSKSGTDSPPQTRSPASVSAAIIADTVYTNGKIYTVNEAQPWAEAIAIKDGKFIVVGSNSDANAVAADSTKTVDLGGKMVLPGIIDTHVHP